MDELPYKKVKVPMPDRHMLLGPGQKLTITNTNKKPIVVYGFVMQDPLGLGVDEIEIEGKKYKLKGDKYGQPKYNDGETR